MAQNILAVVVFLLMTGAFIYFLMIIRYNFNEDDDVRNGTYWAKKRNKNR